ncbi:MAG: beta-galactosidase [Acidimicrobiaceae bacterium]|nr:beta-galactosidase [Acidimicrobiaceae bacterium]
MMKFPEGFLFGVATAAYQIEGAADEDGRGRSIWDTFSRIPGKIHHGDTGDIACDHYHRLDEDLDLLTDIGVGAYRFSVAWPRIFPEGCGAVNQKGLDFYKRLVDGLRERSIKPMLTLYHWDLPQMLQDVGGWTNRDTAFRFAEFVAAVAENLQDDVAQWVTLNEPWCSAFVGHLEGRHAPGEESLAAALHAAHHLLLGHGLAVQALRAANVSGEIGLTLNLSDVTPATESAADLAATARIDGNENRWFLEPVFRGSYPKDMVDWYAKRADLSPLHEADLAIIAAPLDFLGVNYYEQHVVRAEPSDQIHGAAKLAPTPPLTDAGVPIRPAGLEHILRRVSAQYRRIPLYVTENGAAFHDYITPEGVVDDPERVSYLERHFAVVAECASDGVDVRGYFAWSFLDNFEWAEGYSRRFGIVFVDFGTEQRILKSSARWYRQLIAAQ